MRRPAGRSRRRRSAVVLLPLIILVFIVVLVAQRPHGRLPASTSVVDSSGSTPAVATATTTRPPTGATVQALVFTYFYYWYDLPRQVHSLQLTDHPIDPTASCRSVAWFKQQFSDMESAGINVALADYWGAQEPCSNVGITNMSRAIQELRAAGQHPPRIGMLVDTGALGNWQYSERDLTKPVNQKRVYNLVHSFYALLPAADWAFVANRPVVWFWAAYFDITFDRSFFAYLDQHFSADFAYRPYVVGESSFRFAITWTPSGRQMNRREPMPLDDYYEWGAALRGYANSSGQIAEVGPGYDERRLTGPDRVGRYQSRENGQFYERSLQAALASGKPFLVIETWDEFHEATDIADTKEYGRQYIDITRQYVDQFRAMWHVRAGACGACPKGGTGTSAP